LIKKANETKEDVFVRWNCATIRVESTSTVEGLMEEYREQRMAIDKMNAPKDGRDKHLYRITNKLGTFYVVSRSFDEAAGEMKKRLDKANYGFSSYRTVPSIDHLAVQHFYDDKQLFSDNDANLIIVED